MKRLLLFRNPLISRTSSSLKTLNISLTPTRHSGHLYVIFTIIERIEREREGTNKLGSEES